VGLAATANTFVRAADHLDPPMRVDPTMGGTDRAADIADVYAWYRTGTPQTLVAVLSFSGPNPASPTQEIPCDRDVLYGIHISNDDDTTANFDIWARFGEDDVGNCFVQLTGVPGSATPIVGPVERVLQRPGNVMAFAGLRDDAFFFDLEGFRTTLMTGTLSFANDRDFFARQNTPAIVIEFPLVAVRPGAQRLRIWATTSRITAP
jgi:hypothetical protein